MGACESSIKLENSNNLTSTSNCFDSYESLKIILNKNNNNFNLTKSLKEIAKSNQKNSQKIFITNQGNNNLVDRLNSKDGLIDKKINKVSFFKCINTSKTVDKKQININFNVTPNNINKSESLINSLRDSVKTEKISFLKDNSKKIIKTNENIKNINININNINIHNNNGKELKPFYYKPKAFCSSESNNNNHRIDTNNNSRVNKKLSF